MNRQSSQGDDYELPTSPEFELVIQINAKRCWALYSYLDRYVNYKDSRFVSSEE